MTTSSGTRFAGLSILAFAAGLMVVQPAAAIDIFGGQRTQQAPVLMAQAGDTSVRLSQMEDEIRRLTGKVEMSFLVLQLQDSCVTRRPTTTCASRISRVAAVAAARARAASAAAR